MIVLADRPCNRSLGLFTTSASFYIFLILSGSSRLFHHIIPKILIEAAICIRLSDLVGANGTWSEYVVFQFFLKDGHRSA